MNNTQLIVGILITVIILITLSNCFFQQDAVSILIGHLKQLQKLFEKHQDDTKNLSTALAAYSLANMAEMQNGIKALTDKIKKVKENPLESFDLIAKVSQISGIIVTIRTNYGHLLDDPEVEKAFVQYKHVFDAVTNLGEM